MHTLFPPLEEWPKFRSRFQICAQKIENEQCIYTVGLVSGTTHPVYTVPVPSVGLWVRYVQTFDDWSVRTC